MFAPPLTETQMVDNLETEVALAEGGAASITIHNLCRALEAARDKLPTYSPEWAVADFQIRMTHIRFQSLSIETPHHTGDRVGTVELRPVGENAKRDQKPSWANSPEWANWLAMDKDGEWTWFENKPEAAIDDWESANGLYEFAGNMNWLKTLEKRPTPALTSDEPADDGVLIGAALHEVCAHLMTKYGVDWVDYLEWYSESHDTWQTAPDERQLYLAFARNEPIRRKPAKPELTIDGLAQEIRRVDGSHSLGAGALAEALMPYLIAASTAGVTDV